MAAKELAHAKTRLAPALPGNVERAALAEAMFRDVLAAALSARRAHGVAVVTSDPRLIDLSRTMGALVIDERLPRGLNVAVKMATSQLMLHRVTTVCTVLSDIPLVTGEDIDAVFDAAPEASRATVLVPSRDFSGTNMITRTPPNVISTQFGRFSLMRHLDVCRYASIACVVKRLPRPALDLDLPRDLCEFVRTPTVTHTYRHLSRLSLMHG